ncbi:MAG: BatA domain-containing protein [Bacteroidales bacterium]|jgi:hypothetical protein
MVFLQPLFLYGLFLLAIPILIHFLNFRKSKTIYFSSLRFIEEVKTTYRKRNHLTDLLLLFLRLIILACLILAFAQPVLQSEKKQGSTVSSVIGLFIDNSKSMEVSGQNGTLLADAKAGVHEILKQLPPDSRFLLLHNVSADELPGITDKEVTDQLISGIKLSSDQMEMEDVFRYFSQSLNEKEATLSSLILISDFQESLFNKPLSSSTTGGSIFPIPIKPMVTSNISIDTCWLDNPVVLSGQNNSITARINNRSDQDYQDFPVRLILNDSLRNEITIKLPSRTVSEVSLNFHPNSKGWQSGSVQISDFPVVFDNELLFSFRTESDIPVLSLYDRGENIYLKHVFNDDPYFKYEAFGEKGFPRSDLKDYNLVILTGIRVIDSRLSSRVQDYLASGGTVWFFPELDGDLVNYNAFLHSLKVPEYQNIIPYKIESAIARDQTQWLQEVVVNVDRRLRLPFFNKTLKVVPISPDRLDLLNSVSGDLLLSQFRTGAGTFILSAFPLNEKITDLMYHPLFIPICYRIATLSKNSSALYQIIGQKRPVVVNHPGLSDHLPVRISNSKIPFESFPVQQVGIGSETVLYPGHLPAAGQFDAIEGSDTVARIAFNYDRTESDLSYLTDSTLKKRFMNAGWNISMNNNTYSGKTGLELANEIAVKKIWYYFLVMALVALLAESLVMNRKK